jgi:hypothetical protein
VLHEGGAVKVRVLVQQDVLLTTVTEFKGCGHDVVKLDMAKAYDQVE